VKTGTVFLIRRRKIVKQQITQIALKFAFMSVCSLVMTTGGIRVLPCLFSNSVFVSTADASKYEQAATGDVNYKATPTPANPKGDRILTGESRKLPEELDGVGVHEHLGETLDLANLEFRAASDGQEHKLKEYFQSGKPTVLNLVYFQCPMLCTMVLNGITEGMKGLDWKIGDQFNVITVSIDPTDGVESARAKKQTYVDHYVHASSEQTEDSAVGVDQSAQPKGGQSTAAKSESKVDPKAEAAEIEKVNANWNFFTGTETQIKKLADELGFQFKYDSIQKQFAHPAVTFILTPEGKISRYLYGIQYRPRDLRLSLLEAARGRIGNVFDRLLMFCYHYEPSARGYTLQAMKLMQASGAGTLVIFGGYLTLFWTRQRKGKKK
jgi:protein SCO1/2